MISMDLSYKLAVPAMLAGIALVPTSAAAEGFDGPYVGAEAGIAIAKSQGSTLAGPFDTSDNTLFVGGVVGYRSTVTEGGRLVLGVEGDLGIYTEGGDIRYGVSALAGFALGDNSLVYGRVGYAGLDGLPSGAGDGLMWGGGFETKLTDQVNLRLDYKHLDLGGIDFVDNTAKFSAHEITAGLILEF